MQVACPECGEEVSLGGADLLVMGMAGAGKACPSCGFAASSVRAFDPPQEEASD